MHLAYEEKDQACFYFITIKHYNITYLAMAQLFPVSLVHIVYTMDYIGYGGVMVFGAESLCVYFIFMQNIVYL